MAGDRAAHAVVVGASLAGLRGAEALRQAGFSGRLTIVGAEAHEPYDRTPFSKHVLTGEIAPQATRLPRFAELGADWRLGVPASSLDRRARRLHLADGSALAYDRLLIATGARAHPWPNPRESVLDGVHTLRDREDALRLRAALKARPRRVVVIGGGFIGCEVAHAARSLGIPVTLVEAAKAPLARVLGTLIGSIVGARLEAAGIELRLGRQVARLEDDGSGHVIRAMLDDGHAVDTPLFVAATGIVPNTEWLEGSGLALHARGLACDERTRALGHDGEPDGAIFAAGDIAYFPHPLFDGRRVVLDHWQNAQDQGAYAGAMMAGAAPTAPYAAMPAFWSAQDGFNLKMVGLTEGADGVVFAEGDPRSGRFLVAYGRAGRLVAAVSFDNARALPAYAERIARGAPFPPIDAAGAPAVLPPDLV